MENAIAILVVVIMALLPTAAYFFFEAQDAKAEIEALEKEIDVSDIEFLRLSNQNSVNELGVEISKGKIKELQKRYVTEVARNVTLESELDVLAYDRKEVERDYYDLVRNTTDVVYYDKVNNVLVYSGDLVKIGDFNE